MTPIDLERSVPMIAVPSFPDVEMPKLFAVTGALMSLARFVRAFEAAVALFDTSTTEHAVLRPLRDAARARGDAAEVEAVRARMATLSAWRDMAGRDGALQIYNIGTAMAGIRAAMHECEVFHTYVDVEPLRTATKLFESYFPMYDETRHAVAHAGEAAAAADRHAADVMGVKGFTRHDILGRTFTTTFNKQHLSYDISGETAGKLRGVVEYFFQGFEPAALASRVAPYKKLERKAA